MDIKEAELEALKAAKRTIQRFFARKLTICPYYREEDFVIIRRFLDRILPQYQFAIGYFRIHAEEIVLYASTEDCRSDMRILQRS
jgi:hypothetical protein